MTEPETVALLVAMLHAGDPFVHVRFGDGDVFFATGTGPRLTADGEEWTPELGSRLMWAWRTLAEAPVQLLVGDVESYEVSDGCEAEWLEMREQGEWLRGRAGNGPIEFVHIEALRAGRGHALPLYQALAADRRRKALVAPETLAGAARMLGADHVPVPLHVAHEAVEDAVEAVTAGGYDIVLVCAGRGGKIAQAHLADRLPWLVQIDVGSGLDLLFDGGVRRGTDLRVDRDAVLAAYRDAGLLP